jgi:hypothetical protein
MTKQSALKQNALTSGGLMATFRSVFMGALFVFEGDVGDGPAVVRALVLAGAR